MRRTPDRTRSPLAVVLLSGGMDSATTLAIARSRGFRVITLTVLYGQRHDREVRSARRLARHYGAEESLVVRLPLRELAPSALTRREWSLPRDRSPTEMGRGIPSTYVPARNTIFLSLALAVAESRGARAIYLGVNALDYSGYPDCRPSFLQAFQRLIPVATATRERSPRSPVIRLAAPLVHKTKADIVRLGERLGVPWELTWSCYAGGRSPCGRCDSCLLREKGFSEAGRPDPLRHPPHERKAGSGGIRVKGRRAGSRSPPRG